jgi:septal ring factor EnvC (AmiA/AmiB activator)
MKCIHLAQVMAICLLPLVISSCSEQSKASLKVAKQKAEDQLAETVGKGQVALQMYRDRHAEIEQQIVAIKAMSKRTERKISEKEAQLASIPADQVEKRKLVQSMVDHYKEHKAMLVIREEEGIKALKKSHDNYDTIRIKVELLEERIDSAKAMGSFETALDPGTTSKEMNRLITMMEKDLDTAEAQFEIGDLDLDI